MKIRLSILFLLFFFLGAGYKGALKEKLTLCFLEKSALVIKGESNINRFNCVYDPLNLSNSLSVVYQQIGDKLVFENTALLLSNNSFDCGGRRINRDFHKLLLTDKYPEIKMKLKNIELPREEKDSITTQLDFTISSITKSFEVLVAYKKEKNTINFNGLVTINIEDFNLQPPKKVLGLIKVKNNINVEFNLFSTLE